MHLLDENIKNTKPSVNYAKDWLDQFLINGLVWSEKVYHLCDHYGAVNSHFGHFQHGDEQLTKQTTGWSKCKPTLDK